MILHMASHDESFEQDLNVDTVLQQYMYDLETCTTDLSRAPPAFGDLEPFSNFQQPGSPAVGFCDSLYPGFAQSCPALRSDIVPNFDAADQPADSVCGPSAGVKRTEAWTAKNRRAQKRFREKQKVSTHLLLCHLRDVTKLWKTCHAEVQLASTGTERTDGRTACSHSCSNAAAKNRQWQDSKP